MTCDIQILAKDGEALSMLYGYPTESLTDELEKTLVIMLHDFPGDKAGADNLYVKLESMFLGKGLHTLRFDFRGCGESGGLEENFTFKSACEDVQSVLEWAKEKKGYDRFILVAEGFGASVGIASMQETILFQILMWPILDFFQMAENVFHASGFEKKAGGKEFITLEDHKIGRALVEELVEADLEPFFETVEVPTLIMHGVEDKISPVEQLEIVRTRFQSPRIEITTFHDGEHGLAKPAHRKVMFYHVMQFIEKYT
ncbi:MAG: hypothetical protein KDJ75_06920 [Alphaproteobacteria bacterium]|nr:hypothetical protein [Alphaproteobacteria bacterium]